MLLKIPEISRYASRSSVAVVIPISSNECDFGMTV